MEDKSFFATAVEIGKIITSCCETAVESTSRNIVSKVDTTGAGDAFASGFLYGLVKGKGLEECGHLGDIVAGSSVTKLGTRQGFPTLNELAQRYQELHTKE